VLAFSITVDPHKLFLAAAVVQATFGLTLALLAWADRRTHGMFWLAASAGLEFFSTGFRLWNGFDGTGRWDVPGAALLLATILLMYRGLRWFVVRRELSSQRWPLILGATALTGLLLGLDAPLYGLVLLGLATLAVLIVIFTMLWNTPIVALRGISRVSAVLCGLLIVVRFARLPTAIHLGSLAQPQFSLLGREATLLLMTVLEFSFVAMFVAETNRRLHEETRLDALTGLRNRRSIEETAMRALLNATSNGKPLSLLMLDLDRFKALNDTWGHALGDRALRSVGGVLLNVVGASDCVARLGGEEFAVLVPDRDMEAAALLAERLRATVEGLRLSENGETASLTVSIGVSTLRAGERDWEPMLHRADVALYRAKSGGRNRVTLCDATGPVLDMKGAQPHSWWAKLLAGRGPVL